MPCKFLTLEAALDYFHSLSDSELDDEHEHDLRILLPDKDASLSDEEHINGEALNEVYPKGVCGQVDLMLSDVDTGSNSSDDQLHNSGYQKGSTTSCSTAKAKKWKQESYLRWKKYAKEVVRFVRKRAKTGIECEKRLRSSCFPQYHGQ
ncbi:uncharacterized protein LOC129223183 [Uloborus diversus]|uniref:uncharacterized protein LOC129223183 n=1 Tax=Uloborus diversus TaxID=327109 RepID=UPI00240A287B|nr:uncharacterized protein LOC129223183 [Uloborus diversus]